MSAPGYQISRDPTAVIGTRTAAWIVDFLLYMVLIVGVLGPTPLSPLAEYSEVPDGMSMETACDRVGDLEDVSSCFLIGDRVYFTDSSDAAIQVVGWLAYVGLIYIVWQGLTGMTPGKLLFGLRAVGEDGRPPGMLKALIRSVSWIVDGFPYCIPGLTGFILGLTSTGHRRVGDMAAKTFVVGKADAGQPVNVPGLTATGAYGTPTVYGAPGYASQVPSSAPWGTPPGAPGAPGTGGYGAPGSGGYAAPGAPAPGGPAWGTPPAAPSSSGGFPAAPAAPGADARPAPPTSPPAAPSFGAPSPAPAPAAPDTAPTAPAPPAADFGESGDPSEADAPAGATTPSAGEVPTAAAEPESATTTTDDVLTGDDEGKDESPEPAAAPEAPAAPESPAPAPTVADATVEQTYSPQWDAARGAYIQWDPNRSRWLQWDDTGKEWKPI